MTPLKIVAPGEVARIMLLVICIGLLLTGSLWILLPFLVALAWATMIVIATWPILLRVQQGAGGRRWVAVVVMTLVALADRRLRGLQACQPSAPASRRSGRHWPRPVPKRWWKRFGPTHSRPRLPYSHSPAA
jgi:hypothetical protein